MYAQTHVRLLCCVGSDSSVAAAVGIRRSHWLHKRLILSLLKKELGQISEAANTDPPYHGFWIRRSHFTSQHVSYRMVLKSKRRHHREESSYLCVEVPWNSSYIVVKPPTVCAKMNVMVVILRMRSVEFSVSLHGRTVLWLLITSSSLGRPA